MKVMNITKISMIWIISAALIFMAIGAYAYNSAFDKTSSAPVVFGHSADEVNVKLNNEVMTLQSAMSNISGKTLCKLTITQLRNSGCPSGHALLKFDSTNAYCAKFYSLVDNSQNLPANPIQNCYS